LKLLNIPQSQPPPVAAFMLNSFPFLAVKFAPFHICDSRVFVVRGQMVVSSLLSQPRKAAVVVGSI
jgi:hypothetical protein